MAESITDIVVESLATYLKANIKGIRDVTHGFPEKNVNLKYPSISITPLNPRYTNHSPYIYEQGQVSNNKADVKWVVGQYDWKFQLDLWERTREELDDFYEKFFNAMHKNIPESTGVILTMDKYHGNTCEYTMTGSSPTTKSGESTRKQWRMTVDIISNCMAIIENSQYIINQTELTNEIGETTPAPQEIKTI